MLRTFPPRAALLLALVFLLPAVPAAGAPARQPSSEPSLPPEVAPLPADLAARLRELTEAAERARGLASRRPVRAGLIDPAALERQVAAILQEELPPARLAAIEDALQAFGFVPEDLDLARYLPELMAGEVAGFYDPEKKYLAIVRQPGAVRPRPRDGAAGEASDFERRSEDTVVVHELVHALQDQHFDLEKLKGEADPLSDAASARDALIEGDATLAMFSFLLGARVEEDPAAAEGVLLSLASAGQAAASLGSDELAKAPAWLRESLLFSYVEGAAFCLDLLRTGGRPLLDRAYADPPRSTEQVLHPEKWHGRGGRRDDPVAFAWPDLGAALPGFRERVQGELGERDVRLLLREALGERGRAAADAAAAGWGGDRFAVYLKGRKRLLVWLSEWDSAADADEAAAAAGRLGRGWQVERLSPTRVGVVRGRLAGRHLPAVWRVLAGVKAERAAGRPAAAK